MNAGLFLFLQTLRANLDRNEVFLVVLSFGSIWDLTVTVSAHPIPYTESGKLYRQIAFQLNVSENRVT